MAEKIFVRRKLTNAEMGRKTARIKKMLPRGKQGFVELRHKKALEQRLLPAMPRIMRSIVQGNGEVAVRLISEVLAEAATGYALMATGIANRTERGALRVLAKRLIRVEGLKTIIEAPAEEMGKLERIIGDPKKAAEFVTAFSRNYNEMAKTAGDIVRADIKKNK